MSGSGRSNQAMLVVAVAALSLVGWRAPGAQQPRDSAGVVRGVVRDEAGHAIAGAHVSAAGSGSAVTDSAGGFALRGVPSGAVTLLVRRLGFSPLESRVSVGDSSAAPIELRVKPIAAVMPAVRVQARAEPFQSRIAGFYDRRAKKLGYYITRADIEKRDDFQMTSALRRLPGVRVYTMQGALGKSVHLAGAQCPPLVFVDGFAATLSSFDLDMIDLAGVEGVEVYPNGASVPSEFATVRGSECGVIAIWSRPTRIRPAASERSAEKPDVAGLVAKGEVYLPGGVDEQAVLLTGSAQPTYPDSLFSAGIAGHVVAQFVVDTAGDVEPETLEIVSTTSRAFGEAVRAAALEAHFEPARKYGRAVRELVSVPFDFDPRARRGANSRPD